MCGVVGFFNPTGSQEAVEALCRVFRESKIRGLHAFGFSTFDAAGRIQTEKRHELEELLAEIRARAPELLIGHSRYSTSGDFEDHNNNQPVHVGARSLVFNGVIDMGTREEMERRFGFEMETENDGEIFLHNSDKPVDFLRSIGGSFAGLFLRDGEAFFLRNARRPAWTAKAHGATFVASTSDILRRAGLEDAQELPTLKLMRLRDL